MAGKNDQPKGGDYMSRDETRALLLAVQIIAERCDSLQDLITQVERIQKALKG